MSNVIRFISSLQELYKKILSNESTDNNEVDFLLENLHEQGEEIRKRSEEWKQTLLLQELY